jgi:methyl-accepting chemotaxis protein
MMMNPYLLMTGMVIVVYLGLNGVLYWRFRTRVMAKVLAAILPWPAGAVLAGFVVGLQGLNLYTVAGMGVVTGGFALLSLYVLNRMIVAPLNQTRAAFCRLAEGELTVSLPEPGNDEIGEMVKAGREMVSYFQQMAQAANRIAAGDLTIEVVPQSEQDRLGVAFRDMVSSLREVVGSIAWVANKVISGSDRLRSGAAQAGEASQQIAEAIMQVARGTADQSHAVGRIMDRMAEFSAAVVGVDEGSQQQTQAVGRAKSGAEEMDRVVERVAKGANGAAEASDRAEQVAREGEQAAHGAVSDMTSIEETVNDVAAKVRELGEHSAQIGEIIAVISEIAEQTNLLALNAAIEAARAGEQGRGFAVVAEEVRHLAERSQRATQEIAALVTTVQQGIEGVTQAMAQGVERVTEGTKSIETTGESLAAIRTAVQEARERVRGILELTELLAASNRELITAMSEVSAVAEENRVAAQEMAANSEQMSVAMEGIAAVSQENSAAAEEVSAATEEVTAQVQAVQEETEGLNELAEQLQAVVARFHLNGLLSTVDVVDDPSDRRSAGEGNGHSRGTIDRAPVVGRVPFVQERMRKKGGMEDGDASDG